MGATMSLDNRQIPDLCRFMRQAALLAALVGFTPLLWGAEGAGLGRDISGVWVAIAADPPARLGPAMPALAPAGQAMVKEFEDAYGPDAPEPSAYCVPMGIFTAMFSLAAYPIEIIQQHRRITMLAEYDMQNRRIYMDGRGHPADYPHTIMGHSIGHWDGDTLVVDTALLTEWHYFSWPHSDQTRIEERIHLMRRTDAKVDLSSSFASGIKPVNDKLLVDEFTINDPGTYITTPKITMYYERVMDDNILEYDCVTDIWRQALDAHKAK